LVPFHPAIPSVFEIPPADVSSPPTYKLFPIDAIA